MKKESLVDFYGHLLNIRDGAITQERYYREFLSWVSMHYGINAFAAKYSARPSLYGLSAHSLTLFVDDISDGAEIGGSHGLKKRDVCALQTVFNAIINGHGIRIQESLRRLDFQVKPLSEALIAYGERWMTEASRELMVKRLEQYGLACLLREDSLYVVQIAKENQYGLSLADCRAHIRRVIADHVSIPFSGLRIDPSRLDIMFVEVESFAADSSELAVNF